MPTGHHTRKGENQKLKNEDVLHYAERSLPWTLNSNRRPLMYMLFGGVSISFLVLWHSDCALRTEKESHHV